MIIVLMGVTASGKSTVGKLLAQQLGWSFFEGDDFHSPENIEKFLSGAIGGWQLDARWSCVRRPYTFRRQPFSDHSSAQYGRAPS